LGYLFGKTSSRIAKVKVNLPLLFAASILPDVDMAIGFIMHRGPTHSLIILTFLMVPFFVIFSKQAFPYYVALISHVLIGDFVTEGCQLLWPLSELWFGALNIEVTSLTNAIVELALFLLILPFMYKLGDIKTFLLPKNKNWAITIPLAATFAPLLWLALGQKDPIPILLVVPSIFYIGLFTYAISIWLRASHTKNEEKLQINNG
jgi:membrane-bound metal-dependent hydrolase YbcI (DUF457 family)